MKITYTNTFRDLLAFELYHESRSPVTVLVYALGLGFVAYFAFQGTTEDPAKGIGLAACIVGTFIFMAIFTPIMIAVQLAILALSVVSRQNKTLLTEHTLSLGEDSFVTENAYARADLKWSVVQKLRRTRRHVFIYVSQHGAYVVPRRAFHDEAEWQAFHEFCRRKAEPVPTPTDL